MRPRTYLFFAFWMAGTTFPASLPAQWAQQRIEWNRPAEPFHLIDNVHFVGTHGLSAFLIEGPDGHALIDGGLPESAPLIAANIRKLGFDLKDIRYLLINHAHFDHSGGLKALKEMTGAQLLASAGDRPSLESGTTVGRTDLDDFPPTKVDREIKDGETLRIGESTLTAVLTPGHTPGCTSWLLRTPNRKILFACSLTVAGQKLVGDPAYPQAAADFRHTFDRLETLQADVFLNFHPDFFDLEGKRARLSAGDSGAFVDKGELQRQVQAARRAFEEELAQQRR